MEETKKLLGSVTVSPKIVEEIETQVKDIESFKIKIEEYLIKNVTELLDVIRGAPLKGVLSHPKLLAALFAEDSLKKKRNTEAVEVAPGTLVSARVLEHKPAALQPLETVKTDIEKFLGISDMLYPGNNMDVRRELPGQVDDTGYGLPIRDYNNERTCVVDAGMNKDFALGRIPENEMGMTGCFLFPDNFRI